MKRPLQEEIADAAGVNVGMVGKYSREIRRYLEARRLEGNR